MMRKSLFCQFILPLMALLVALSSGCRNSEEQGARGLQSQAFYERYNKYINDWLVEERERTQKALTEKKEALGTVSNREEKKRLQGSIKELDRELSRHEFRQSLGDFFSSKEAHEIPENLNWEDGMDEPEIGDPSAKKGGAFQSFWSSFPPTVRQFGSNSNNGARSDLYDLIEVALVGLHPVTQKIIPGIAKEWAIGADERTVFFRIHPEAKFNDGHPIEAEDFFTWARLRLADQVDSIFAKQYIREQFAQFTIYGPSVIAITLPEAKPLIVYHCALSPAATHFYDDFGPDFEERYQWVVPPTTAAYRLNSEDLVKGESVTLTRVDDWWLKDKKYYRYRYNADKILYRVVRDQSKAWELFRAGEIDSYGITLPKFYYDKSEMPPVFDGYIERTTWYNQYPRIPWGLYLNVDEPPLDHKAIRRGIAHATNWEKVIDIVFRGDYSRLDGFTSGYGSITEPSVKARVFSIEKAREAFAAAGYTQEDKDGILMTSEGQRLDVAITFTSVPTREQMMVILKEEAKKAGLNFILDGREATASYKKVVSKEHQITFSAWQFTPPFPGYYQFFHSRNAFDEKGNRKTQTNNVFSYASDRMDQLTEAFRNARTLEELTTSAHEIQRIIAEEDLFIPGFTNEFSRIASWRWIRWPDVEDTRFAPPLAYSPVESYCYWIDEDVKKETLAAKRSGKVFPEVERVVEAYRVSKKKGG